MQKQHLFANRVTFLKICQNVELKPRNENLKWYNYDQAEGKQIKVALPILRIWYICRLRYPNQREVFFLSLHWLSYMVKPYWWEFQARNYIPVLINHCTRRKFYDGQEKV